MDFEYSVKADIVSDTSVCYRKRGRTFFVEPQTESESCPIYLCPTELEIIIDCSDLSITGFKGKLTPKDKVLKGDIFVPQYFDGKICINVDKQIISKEIRFVCPFERYAVYDTKKKSFMFGKIPDNSLTVRVCKNLYVTIGDSGIEAVTVMGV